MDILKNHLNDQFTYNHHANGQFIEQLEASSESVPERVHELFGHILNAHGIWLARIAGKQNQAPMPWDEVAPDKYSELNEVMLLATRKLLDEGNINRKITYKSTSGTEYFNTVKEILSHVILHSMHHRAQIAILLRQQDIDPPASDYIFFRRSPTGQV